MLLRELRDSDSLYYLKSPTSERSGRNGEPKLMFVILAIFTPLLMTGTLSIFYSSGAEQFRHSVFSGLCCLALTELVFIWIPVPWNHFGIYL